MADFEDRLRESLQARAADVTPDPAMYADVQRRIRRSRVTRWSLAGAGAVAVVAVAALVVPSVLDRRIEFEPGPVATQPPTEEHSYNQTESPIGEMPLAAGMVFSDGPSTYAMALDGESATALSEGDPSVHCPDGDCTSEPYITAVAVAPGSSSDAATVVYHRTAGCGELLWGDADLEGDEQSFAGGELPSGQQCPTAAVFSPDGGHVAWAAREPGGQWFLSTLDWTAEGPGGGDATYALDWGGGASDVRVEDWVWTSVGADGATGYVVLTVRIGEHVETFRREVTRQADGDLSLFGDQSQPMGGEDGATPVAFADANSAVGGALVSYTLEVMRDDAGHLQGRVVRRVDDREAGAFALPPELFNTTNPPFDAFDLWLEAMGDTVVYGGGHGIAWSLRWTGSDFDRPRNLPASIVHADLFGGDAAEPGGGAVPDDRKLAQVDVDVYFVDDGGECGELVTPQLRSVEGSGVLRGALEHLLAGPTPEEVAAGAADQTGFDAATAGLLNDVSIAENGVARIDFDARLAEQFQGTSCSGNALFSMLEPTVRQFPSVKEVVYSFDGSIEQFYSHYQLEAPAHRPTIPLAVTRMRDRIRDAVVATRDDDWDPLAELIDRETFSCSFSDQNEDCIALWQQQEADGQDPLGPLQEILRGAPAKVEGAPIWAWPVEFVEGDEYLGPRTGIQRNGTWRYYQQGGD